MKIKITFELIVTTILVLWSNAIFAASSGTCYYPKGFPGMGWSDHGFVNTCAPEVTLYVAGSQELYPQIANSLINLFDKSKGLVQVIDKNSYTPYNTWPLPTTHAWYGMSKPGLLPDGSKRLYIVYSTKNGSAAGVSQVMTKVRSSSNLPEANVVFVGPINKTLANTCESDPKFGQYFYYPQSTDSRLWAYYQRVVFGPSTNYSQTAFGRVTDVVFCTNTRDMQADLAISDVRVQELQTLYPSAANTKISDLVQTALGIQGFGIAVNWKMYQALQKAQFGDGCVGALTYDCQPSIRKIDYSTLITSNSKAKSAAIFGLDSAVKLTLARRDDFSGTQAASNIYFANNPCGNIPSKSTNLGGSLVVLGASDKINDNFEIKEFSTPAELEGYLSNPTEEFIVGVLPLLGRGRYEWPNQLGRDTGLWQGQYNFIKIDGYSPNLAKDAGGNTIRFPKGRNSFANGDYSFAMSFVSVYNRKAISANSDKQALISAFNAFLSDSDNDLSNIAYFDGKQDIDIVNTRQSKVVRGVMGNNCSPLVLR